MVKTYISCIIVYNKIILEKFWQWYKKREKYQEKEKLDKEYGIKVDKKNFKNYMPIKAVGKATVDVVLYKEIVGKINIEVKEI